MVAIDSVLEIYLQSYRELIAAEQVGDSAVLSFPLHLAASHRIEITVTRFGKDSYILSDSARTLGEVEAAGYSLSGHVLERLEAIAGASGLRIVDTHLVLESTWTELGASIQQFLEVSKTIGDVYLVHKQRERPDSELMDQIREILRSMHLPYKVGQRIKGEIEAHPFDLVVPPNGRPGIALSVLTGQNTHSVAQIWGFKCEDVRRGDWYKQNRAHLALIYDVRTQAWSQTSRSILENRADIALPSDALGELRSQIGSRAV